MNLSLLTPNGLGQNTLNPDIQHGGSVHANPNGLAQNTLNPSGSVPANPNGLAQNTLNKKQSNTQYPTQ